MSSASSGQTATLIAIAKDEGLYLEEWILHHLNIGFKKIYIYDNESQDDTQNIISSLSQKHEVHSIIWKSEEGRSPQITAYNHALSNLDLGDWVAFFDLDEFLVFRPGSSLCAMLDAVSKNPDAGAIGVNQRVFGSSGHSEWHDEPVLSRFKKCSKTDYVEAEWVKSIYKRSCISKISDCHASPLNSGVYYTPSGDKTVFKERHGCASVIDFSVAQLNHYITKSMGEFLKKRERGGGMGSTKAERLNRYTDLSFFHNRQGLINSVDWEDYELYSKEIRLLLEKNRT